MSADLPSSTLRSGQNARLALAVWGVAAIIAGLLAALSGVPPLTAGAGAAICLLPAILGFALSPVLRREWAQVLLICAWTGLAIAACFVLGAASGAACWFILAPLAAFKLGRRSLILETGVTSMLGLGLATALEAGNLAPALYPATEHPVLSALAVAMAIAMATAVAVAARREAAAERSAARRKAGALDALSDHLPGAALRVDSGGNIIAAAGACQRLLGGNPAGRSLASLAPEAQAALDSAREAGGEAVADLTLPNGASVELRIALSAEGAIGVIMDTGLRAERERAYMAERDAAIAASEAKSRFLASMSHEIRTPLNAIIGFSDVMKQRLFGPMPARYAEYADMIHESGRHLLDLVGDVLDMSKIEADRYDLKLDQMDARDIAAAATKLMRLRAEEAGVRLGMDCGMAPLPVRADRKALRQILLNLLSNALKFTPRGGEVRLRLRSDGGELVLEIADTGAGMSAEDVQRIGQPYRQAGSADATAERGTGLGLSLVAALAQLHGGALEIESALGKGTTARVRLPVLETAAPVRLDARARLQRVAAASEEILKVQAEAQA